MSRTPVGHLHTPGFLNGQPVAIVVDTGASATIVDLGFCQARGLTTRETAAKGGGAGGMSLTLHLLENARLQLGAATLSPGGIRAMDLSHVNKGLAQKGAEPIQMVIGADILTRHEAVIDYATLSLFLRVAKT
ncbi:MAG TPA: aspartyl protease family protein [Candidatus Didemnitutus sp.]|nr:aspartyl protease family protein [Candidatus Didemnitutus sp.]